jgi:phosphoglucosamine mutase
VRFNGGQPLEHADVKRAIAAAEARLAASGRLLIRKSGTEPLIRVMAEAEDERLVDEVVGSLAGEIARVAGAGG